MWLNHPAARDAPPTEQTGDLSRICAEVAALFRRRWGRGPRQTRAYWAGPDVLVVLMENGHTDAEKTMRAAGHITELLEGRHLLQGLVEGDLCRIVEEVTDREVATSLSATRLDPDLSAEIFLLAPAGDVGTGRDEVRRAAGAMDSSQRLADETRAVMAQNAQARRRAERPRGGGGE